MSKFKAILWDNDGVLVDTEHLGLPPALENIEKLGGHLAAGVGGGGDSVFA